MELIIIRHGLAEDREEFLKKGIADEFRPLVIKGKKRTEKLANHLKPVLPSVDLIVTSPFVRSKQTAQILAEQWGGVKVVEAPELMPQNSPQVVVKWLKAHSRSCNRVVLVGHEPQLSALTSYLLTGHLTSRIISFKKSGAVSLSFESFVELKAGAGVLLNWCLFPKLL